MKKPLVTAKPADFYAFGYDTRTQCCDTERAIRICTPTLHALEDQLRPGLRRLACEIANLKNQALALHSYLYDRPIPVDDAKMLSLGQKIRVLALVAAIAALGCLVGNMATFYLWGFSLAVTLLGAVGMTGLPLAVGHLAFEWIMASSRWLQVAVVIAAVSLMGSGIYLLGQARRDMIDRAVSKPAAHSYVDGADTDQALESTQPPSGDTTEATINRGSSNGLLLIVMATDLALAFTVGLLVHLFTKPKYAAWRELKKVGQKLIAMDAEEADLLMLPEIAKKHCLAGILRAESDQNQRRRPPYHPSAAMTLTVFLFVALCVRAQTNEHYQVIVVDASASISHGGRSNELFREYLHSVRKLLQTTPPNSRVWVLTISTDSFGGAHEILKGWTPDAPGVFTDNLDRARRELASAFEQKSAGMAPLASGTDIFGALWRIKALIESDRGTKSSASVSKDIWIFSDMMNETQTFLMPKLLDLGRDAMLARAKANGLIVPLQGYKVHVYGASTENLTAQAWMTAKEFWAEYFSAAGAELVVYSEGGEARR